VQRLCDPATEEVQSELLAASTHRTAETCAENPGCPTLAAFLFLRLGWDTREPLNRNRRNVLVLWPRDFAPLDCAFPGPKIGTWGTQVGSTSSGQSPSSASVPSPCPAAPPSALPKPCLPPRSSLPAPGSPRTRPSFPDAPSPCPAPARHRPHSSTR